MVIGYYFTNPGVLSSNPFGDSIVDVVFYTAQEMKFSIKDFFSKRDQIRSFLRIWSHSLKKSLMENFIFCAVSSFQDDQINSWDWSGVSG